MTDGRPPRILFVCLGNICRSPLAEAAMRAAAEREDVPVEVDSAGTGDWHVGKAPDRRAIATAYRHGLDIAGLRARQVGADDFRAFDRLVALDRSNLDTLRAIAPEDGRAQLSLLLDHVAGREGEDVADPYFGEDEGFEQAWRDICAGVGGLLAELAGQPSR
ncbi:low molecular weight phosphotyrosine protein phosphatase [Sphingomonas histidinilytica]|jgi:protein-tyrosine phosphatase|uniref:protein-tyrosine-phosphatase n=1 Tax=Rhizorhabdus histidinilytica TaxID=439228 RepID=A0A1T5GFI2_9SPHN|nr:low molecular weight protein-tyrosine-phosphatase [Rhizorhabdus histidinilytica]MBO9378601.1 low molecular weight phosphotyrosine protein phosphatase [Rhizorhabdus histidinilytica]QEH77682.1 low molecular weight phosphotyrosine protein phosphatase [Sphingomonas sp. C8-2]SKC07057.1 protein-tyrosine phosphatase [Rhizorhabdus histidinilytica]